ncbi:MAG: 2Fe-2S iron-sulfur cluster binding domain-containing protein [Nannocystaceae bacterium]
MSLGVSMPVVRVRDAQLAMVSGETVLECLERNGYAIPSSCRAGTCRTCLARATLGEVPAAAHVGLRPAEIEAGYFLPCVCRPRGDITLVDEAFPVVQACVLRKQLVGADVALLHLRPDADLHVIGGQCVHVQRDPGAPSRPYSVASGPGDSTLELHVRRVVGGSVSPWLVDQLEVGESVLLRGPSGTCVYTDGDLAAPLVLIATSTGLAPLLGVIRRALHRGHHGPIRLHHGAATRSGLYLQPVLQTLERAHDNVRVLNSVRDEGGDLGSEIARMYADASALQCFLAGAPGLVHALRRQLFLQGAALSNIAADAFAAA